ncbi:MAG: EamA family transporter [Candidatus Microgenomates bacterium]
MESWVIFALLSAIFAAATSILAKIGITGVDSNLATAIRTVVITVFAWGIVFAQGSIKTLPALSKTTWIFLALSGIATGLSWLFYFRALQLGDASKVVPIDKLSLVLAVIMAGVFLHEKITLSTIIGSTLITAGVLVMALWK